jgi:hypothetical protein
MIDWDSDEASRIERQMSEDHSHQGGNEMLHQLTRVGRFLRDADGQVHYYREATGALYEVNTKPHSAFGRLLTFLMPALTGSDRREQIEEMMTFLGWEATPMRLAVTDESKPGEYQFRPFVFKKQAMRKSSARRSHATKRHSRVAR